MPEAVKQIAQRLESEGYETWAVGGAVREALSSDPRIRADWDLATAATPEVVQRLFRRSYPIGIEFGTVGVRGSDDTLYEVTTFRRDISTDGRHAVVEFSDSIDEDLARRDFTINAIALHPLRGEIRDPFSGQEDLRKGILRCVGEPALRFAEDYLRVLRGLRFAGMYDLEIDPPTWDALKDAVEHLPRLSAERVREESLKVLALPDPKSALDLYRRSGTLAKIVPQLASLSDDAWAQTLEAVKLLPEDRTELRLAALFAPAAPDVESILSGLRFSNAEIREARALTNATLHPLPPADTVVARRWIREITPERAEDALKLLSARAQGGEASAAELSRLGELESLVTEILERGDPVTLAALAIDGNDLKTLGLEPGPEFARILEECLDAVIEDPSLNVKDRLLDKVREWQAP